MPRGPGQLWGPGPSWIFYFLYEVSGGSRILIRGGGHLKKIWGHLKKIWPVADPGVCVTGMIPPPLICPDTENLWKVCVTDHPPPLGMWMTSHGHCPRGGASECPRVEVFFNFSKGG